MENKVIFESKEDAKKFLISILPPSDLLCDAKPMYDLLNKIEQKGYIRKSVVEEAEEMYHNWNQSKPGFIYDDFRELKNLCVIMYEAIQELKKSPPEFKNV